ncbi:MAG TPA: CGNR zinc finger domain-containing protein [Vicinamibacterales bacterium]
MGYDHTLSGGHPVLDFVNSVDDWTVPVAQDYLQEFADAQRFAEAVGLISRREARLLESPPGSRGTAGERRASRSNSAELASLKRLRASLERILRASLEKRATAAEDVATLRQGLVEAARRTELLPEADGSLSRRITVESNGPSALRLRIVDSAMALLSSDAMRHVKACPTCGWFFLDVSKNQSRVWCSMDTCGAQAKARRYYRRTKGSRAKRPSSLRG